MEFYFKSLFLLIFIQAFNLNALSADKNTVVIGHLNPDPDSISGAIAVAHYFAATPARTGLINKESQFLLNFFKVKPPMLISDFKGKNIIAIDFNQKSQAPPNVKDGKLIRIIDHHALLEAPITSEKPIPVLIEPWGSVCTIVAKNLYFKNQRPMPRAIAGLLLGGIISDTLNLRSETTTDNDRAVVKLLAKIAQIKNVDELAFQMFRAKSDVSDLSDAQVLSGDFKEFSLGGKKVGIGVAETVVPADLLARKEGLIKAALSLKKEQGYDYVFFFIVDIDKIKSQLLVIDKPELEVSESAFGGKAIENILDTKNLVSRKLQIGPTLGDYFLKKK